MLTIEEALLALRTEDNLGNQSIINGLLETIPSYIETTTGITSATSAANEYPLIRTLATFLLCLWYNPDGTDAARLQIVVDNLLKTLKAMASDINGGVR